MGMFFSFLDSLVPASSNFFHCPVYVCVLCVLSCTVYVGVGARFPQSVSLLVYCPFFCLNGTRLCCLAALHHSTGGWPFTLNTKKLT